MTESQLRRKMQRRAAHLSDKHGLSYQLACGWIRDNPTRWMRPMLPKDLADLIHFARLGQTDDENPTTLQRVMANQLREEDCP